LYIQFLVQNFVTFDIGGRYTSNVNSFREFYNDNKGRFFWYLLCRSGDYNLAADTMQESFARYLERYAQRELSVSLLFTIGRNLLNDNSRQQRIVIPYDENEHKGTSDEESAYVEREESRRVMSAIQQLAPDEADLLSLVVSSGLSYHQIAELTGTSEGNIKVRIHRCRQKLKKILHTGET